MHTPSSKKTKALNASEDLSNKNTTAVLNCSVHSTFLSQGTLFIPTKGQKTDGHTYVAEAFQKGAVASLVSVDPQLIQPALSPAQQARCLWVQDTLTSLALMAETARQKAVRTKRIGITGTCGKTGAKESLYHVLQALGFKTHKPPKSYNTVITVPLTMANMPKETHYGIFEMGMNTKGTLEGLSQLVKPHVCLITTVGTGHMAGFNSAKEIATEKAKIFSALEAGGTIVLNRDIPFFKEIWAAAQEKDCHIITFGQHPLATLRLVDVTLTAQGSAFSFRMDDRIFKASLQAIGHHEVMNILGVLGVCTALGINLQDALKTLDTLPPSYTARGRVHHVTLHSHYPVPLTLIDASYNANPLSVKAMLDSLGLFTPQEEGRRIAVLGDILEMGILTEEAHTSLINSIKHNAIDSVITVGPLMKKYLWPLLPLKMKLGCFETVQELIDAGPALFQSHDVLAIKGGNPLNLSAFVRALVPHP